MLGISSTELLLILFFGFLVFGPEKLPQIGRTVGRAIRQFRDASDQMSEKIKTEVTDPFQEAMSPYKDQVEKEAGPIREDLEAINKTLKETQDSLTSPFKDLGVSVTPSRADAHSDAATRKLAKDTAASKMAKVSEVSAPATGIAASLYGLDTDTTPTPASEPVSEPTASTASQTSTAPAAEPAPDPKPAARPLGANTVDPFAEADALAAAEKAGE